MAVFRVGPNSTYATTAEAMLAAGDNDTGASIVERAKPMRMREAAFVFGVSVLTVLSPSAHGASVTPQQSDHFVEFIGVNGHLNWDGTVWQSEAETWRARLGELGVRYIRTGMGATTWGRDSLDVIFQDYGVRASILVDHRTNGVLNMTPVQKTLDFLRTQVGLQKIIAIEGPNEYSHTKYASGNANWAPQIRSYQRYLFERVKADPVLRVLPVLGPTIYRRLESDYNELGNLGAYADRGNLHYYNGGRKPNLYAREPVYRVPFQTVESTVDVAIQNAQINAPMKRIFVTETGFNMRYPLEPWLTPERVYAKYAPRLIGDFFLRQSKVEKVFFFSLIDSPGSADKYGLLRGGDLAPRPVFYAIKNLIRILSDKGLSFTPTALNYEIIGDRSGVSQILLQKRDGRHYLLIWNDVDSYDRRTLQELNPPLRQLTLDVSQHRFAKINIYDPTGLGLADPNHGVLPVQTVNEPSTITLNVLDRVLVVEMVPEPVGEPAPSTTTLGSSASPSSFGELVTFTATVSSDTGTPSGTVTFREGTRTLGSVASSRGQAVFSTSALSGGKHRVRAVFGGSANHLRSRAVLTQIVAR